ncbi:hypothetical protein AA0473_0199 [Acetobacter orleanensis NRIC 0473]|nr:hypothetical protein AA0473_0199 [Acetobacter orleanensis NRIC 0473]
MLKIGGRRSTSVWVMEEGLEELRSMLDRAEPFCGCCGIQRNPAKPDPLLTGAC